MHTMRKEIDMFVGLRWEKKAISLGDPHVHFNPSPEHDIGTANRYSNDYEMTQKMSRIWVGWRRSKNDKRRVNVPKKDIDLNEDK